MEQTLRVRSGLSKTQTRATLTSLNWNVGLRSVFDVICGGTTFIFTAFALSLGVPKEHMGYIGSIAGLACVLQLAGMMLARHVPNKKRFVIGLAYAEPVVLLGAVLAVPFLPAGWRLPVLALAILAAAAFLHLTKPLADDWVASVVPAGIRGRYLGRRFQLISLFMLPVPLLVAYLTQALQSPQDAGRHDPRHLALILAAGALFGLAAVLPLHRVSLPALSAEARVSWSDLRRSIGFRPFARYMLALTIITSPFFFSVPFYQAYHLEVLHMSLPQIAWIQVGYFLVKLPLITWFGKLSDRVGPRRVLAVACPLYVLFFVLYALAQPNMVWPVAVAWIAIAAIGDSTWGPATFSALYASIPSTASRPAFFALYNLVAVGLYAVGGILAVQILQLLERLGDLHLAGWTFTHFHLFFALCGLHMLLASLGVLILAPRRGSPPMPDPPPHD